MKFLAVAFRRGTKWFLLCALIAIAIPLSVGAAWSYAKGWPSGWRAADWSSAGVAPNPRTQNEAIVQIYGARTGRWKGVFAIHTWIALKKTGANHFDRYDVVGWGRPVRRNAYPVDGRWYSNTPSVVHEVRGPEAERLIPKIEDAVSRYPYSDYGSYRVWPGPNSNTFVAWVARQVPSLALEMPATAVGKDYLGQGMQISQTPSGTGWQFSWAGMVGIGLGLREGLEVHVLGLTLGIDPQDLAIKLPSLGTLSLWNVTTLFNID